MRTWPQEMGPGSGRGAEAHNTQDRSSCNPPKPKKQTPHPKTCLSIWKMSKTKLAMSTWPQEGAGDPGQNQANMQLPQTCPSLGFHMLAGFLGRSRQKAPKNMPKPGFHILWGVGLAQKNAQEQA